MHRETAASAQRRRPASWPALLSGPLEFVGVLLTAIVLQRLVVRAMGIAPWKATQARMIETGEPDFLLLAELAAVDQIFKWGIMLGLAFAIGWWHRRRRLQAYGVTRAARSWGELIRIGVVLWGVSLLIPGLLQALDDHLPWIGRGPDQWALFPSTWSVEFLLYMAASSFLLVPVFEELAVRGYMLNRLREDYGDAGALLMTAIFFALAHTQYFKLEVLSLGMVVSIVVGSLAAGYVLIRTGSLVPCIVAHALVNLPSPPWPWGEEVVLLVALAVVLVAGRHLLDYARGLLALLRGNPAWGATALGVALLVGVLAVALVFQGRAPLVAALLLAAGLVGDALDRRDEAVATPSPASRTARPAARR